MTIDAPLSIGEIFDHAVSVVIERWRPLLALQAIYAVALLASRIVAQNNHNQQANAIVQFIPTVIGLVTQAAIIATIASVQNDGDIVEPLLLGIKIFWRSFVATLLLIVAFLVVAGVAFVSFILFNVWGGWFVYVAWVLVTIIVTLGISIVFGYWAIAYCNVVVEFTKPIRALRDALKRSATTGSRRVLVIGAGISAIYFLPLLVIWTIPDKWLSDAVRDGAEFIIMMTGYVYAYGVQAVASIDYRNRARGDDLARSLKAAAPA